MVPRVFPSFTYAGDLPNAGNLRGHRDNHFPRTEVSWGVNRCRHNAEVERSDLLSAPEKKAVLHFNPSHRGSAGQMRDVTSVESYFNTVSTSAGCPSSQICSKHRCASEVVPADRR